MPTFDEQYPRARRLTRLTATIARDSAWHTCCHCGGPTRWCYVPLLAWACSDQCARALVSEHAKAQAKPSKQEHNEDAIA